jgi:hypothetical protein
MSRKSPSRRLPKRVSLERSKRTRSPVARRKRGYFTLDNGGRPFYVDLADKQVSVYRVKDADAPEDYEQWLRTPTRTGKLLRRFRVERVWVGKSPLNASTEFSGGYGPKWDGNSLLLQLGPRHYVFVGAEIYEFRTPQELTHFWSPVGNSSVAYPLALSKDAAYFFLGPAIMRRRDFSKHVDWTDAYDEYYAKEQQSRPLPVRRIQGRLF